MKNMFRKMFTLSIFSSILFIVIGMLLFFKPGDTLKTISYVIGGLILVFGIFGIARFTKDEKKGFNFDLMYGILSLIAGLIIIFNPEALASIIPIILGIWIVINSGLKVQYSFYLKDGVSKKWLVNLILSLITLTCGIVLLFNPFKAASYVAQAVGLFIMVYALIDLIQSFIIKDKVKEVVKDASIVVVDNSK